MTSESVHALSFEQLQDAVKKASAFRCRVRLQADGGDGGKVFPPTYAGGVYAVENRRVDGRVVRCVLLDSVQSQANRMEEVLLDAFLPDWRELPPNGQDLRCDLPVVAVHVENHGWITSLTAPHRIHDAILRDSNLNRTRFRDSNIGREIVGARLWNANAFYRYCPTALLFGTWDSTAGEGLDSAKIPRAVVSEIIGVDIAPGVRTGSRIDPLGIKAQAATIYRRTDGDWAIQDNNGGWNEADESKLDRDKNGNPKKFGKGKPSDINHGNVTPDLARFGDRREIQDQHLDLLPDVLRDDPVSLTYELRSGDGELRNYGKFNNGRTKITAHAVKPGGVTLAYALHTWTLSLTQLRRLRFPLNGSHDGVRNEAARTVLAALSLYALALLRERGYWLRSRCELIPQSEGEGCPAVLELIQVDGTMARFSIPDSAAAKELLKEACQKAGKLFASGDAESEATPDNNGLPNPGWEQRVIRLTPTDKLAELVRRSDALTADTTAERQEAAGAGDQD
jgi:CRISPR-associated protein Csb1